MKLLGFRVTLVLVILCVNLCLVASEQTDKLDHYQCETSESTSPESWTTFEPVDCYNPSVFSEENLDLHFSAPFFGVSSYSWYASPYGFLTVTDRKLCSLFCVDTVHTTLFGFYPFQPYFSSPSWGEGGDWPMVGLFVTALEFTKESRICVKHLIKNSRGSEERQADDETDKSVVVEYRNFRVAYSSPKADISAQAEISTDGEIILRYSEKIPDMTKTMREIPPPSVGLIFSKDTRKVLTTPNTNNKINGYRCALANQNCAQSSDCTLNGCSVCPFTNLCTHNEWQKEFCPSGTIGLLSYVREEGFYRVTDDVNDLPELPGAALPFPLEEEMKEPITIHLPFRFPFFDHKELVTTVYLTQPNVISIVTPSQPCNPLWHTCANGNYTMAILPYQTAISWNELTYYKVYSDLDFVIIEVGNFVPFSLQWTAKISTYIGYQIRLSSNGDISMIFQGGGRSPGSPMIGYPTARVGLVRHGLDDPYSVLIPQMLVKSGSFISFTYTGSPSMCSGGCGNGRCDTSSSQCMCDNGFMGRRCDECQSGYYGPSCEPCGCESALGQTCDDGIAGTGHCSGTSCAACNLNHGTCNDGVCTCISSWTGQDCNTPVDECLPLSLNGCPACIAKPNCQYCFDETCFNPLLSNTSAGYTCSYSISSERGDLCHFFPAIVTSEQDLSALAVGGLVLAICLVFSLAALLLFFWNRRSHPLDPHVLGAARGRQPTASRNTDRTVMPINLVRKEDIRRGEYVLGVPLRQASLTALYQNRREAALYVDE